MKTNTLKDPPDEKTTRTPKKILTNSPTIIPQTPPREELYSIAYNLLLASRTEITSENMAIPLRGLHVVIDPKEIEQYIRTRQLSEQANINTSKLEMITINGQTQPIHILPQGTLKDPDHTAVRDLVALLGRGEILSVTKTPIAQQYTLNLRPNGEPNGEPNEEPIPSRPKRPAFLLKEEEKENPLDNQITIAVSEGPKKGLLYLALSCNGNLPKPRLEIDELINMLKTKGTINSREDKLVDEDTNKEKYVTFINYSPDYTKPGSKLQQTQKKVQTLELEAENANSIILELLHQNQKTLETHVDISKLLCKTPTRENAAILKLLGKTKNALKDPVIKGYAKCKRLSPRVTEENSKRAMDIYLDALYNNLKDETKITEKQITSSTKEWIISGHRTLFMFLLRSRFRDKGGSFPYIGKLMGNENQAKNHATVILACQRVSNNGKIILPFDTTGDAKVDYANVIRFFDEKNPDSRFIKKLIEKKHFPNLNLSTLKIKK